MTPRLRAFAAKHLNGVHFSLCEHGKKVNKRFHRFLELFLLSFHLFKGLKHEYCS